MKEKLPGSLKESPYTKQNKKVISFNAAANSTLRK